MSAVSLSSSMAMCGMLPSPVEAKTQLAGLCLRQCDQLGQCRGRHFLADHQDFRTDTTCVRSARSLSG
jgi:hypothetical protein